MERLPITPEGFARLKEQLRHLKSVVRPQNIKDIEVALDHGDLSENAEYHAAKEKQGQIAAQMTQLESKIGRAEVIDPKNFQGTDKIVFGATVKLYALDAEEEIIYKIVGDDESDVKERKIGVSSPVARALIGKKAGDEARVQTPKGIREFEIIGIKYV